MDLAAEFYLQTVETVFVKHALPKGEMMHRRTPVDPAKIRHVALLTVEGEKDDISGVGQTEAAHRLCTGIPAERKAHYLQLGVGHYGVFNGSRFRAEIAPRIADFILSHNGNPRRSAVAARRRQSVARASAHLSRAAFMVPPPRSGARAAGSESLPMHAARLIRHQGMNRISCLCTHNMSCLWWR